MIEKQESNNLTTNTKEDSHINIILTLTKSTKTNQPTNQPNKQTKYPGSQNHFSLICLNIMDSIHQKKKS